MKAVRTRMKIRGGGMDERRMRDEERDKDRRDGAVYDDNYAERYQRKRFQWPYSADYTENHGKCRLFVRKIFTSEVPKMVLFRDFQYE